MGGGGGGFLERNVCPLVKCDVYIQFTDFDHLNTSFSVIIFMRKMKVVINLLGL